MALRPAPACSFVPVLVSGSSPESSLIDIVSLPVGLASPSAPSILLSLPFFHRGPCPQSLWVFFFKYLLDRSLAGLPSEKVTFNFIVLFSCKCVCLWVGTDKMVVFNSFLPPLLLRQSLLLGSMGWIGWLDSEPLESACFCFIGFENMPHHSGSFS